MNFLDNTPNKPSKFRTRNSVEINDEARGTYISNNEIKFDTSIIKSNLCDYSDTYILLGGTVTITEAGVDDAAKAIFKSCALFTDCTRQINNTQVDHSKDTDVVMPMYTLMECGDN